MSLAILVQARGNDVEDARQLDHRVVRGELGELVGRRGEGELRQVARPRLANSSAKPLRRVEAGADGGAALREPHAPAAARFRRAQCSRSICAA